MTIKDVLELAAWLADNPEYRLIAVFNKDHCKNSQKEEYPDALLIEFHNFFIFIE